MLKLIVLVVYTNSIDYLTKYKLHASQLGDNHLHPPIITMPMSLAEARKDLYLACGDTDLLEECIEAGIDINIRYNWSEIDVETPPE